MHDSKQILIILDTYKFIKYVYIFFHDYLKI